MTPIKIAILGLGAYVAWRYMAPRKAAGQVPGNQTVYTGGPYPVVKEPQGVSAVADVPKDGQTWTFPSWGVVSSGGGDMGAARVEGMTMPSDYQGGGHPTTAQELYDASRAIPL